MKDYNLIPQYVLIQRKNKEVEALVTKVCFGVIGLIILAAVSMSGVVLWETMANNRITAEIKKIEYVSELQKKLNGYKKNLEPRRKVVSLVSNQESIILTILDVLEQSLPKGVTVVDMGIDAPKNQIKLSCAAKDIDVVADLINNLRQTDRFKDVYINSIGSEPDAEKKDASSTGDKTRSVTLNLVLKN